MIKYNIFLILLFMMIFSCNIGKCEKSFSSNLNGVYIPEESRSTDPEILWKEREFTWGKGYYYSEFTPVIDLGNHDLAFGLPEGGGVITKVVKLKNNKYELTIEDNLFIGKKEYGSDLKEDVDIRQTSIINIEFLKKDLMICTLPENGKDETSTYYALNNTFPGAKKVKLIRYKKIYGPDMPYSDAPLQRK